MQLHFCRALEELNEMRDMLNKLDDILGSAISIMETAFQHSATAEYAQPSNASAATTGEQDLFKSIYGHENIKAVLCMALRSQKTVHVLLSSPPGMAKTQFLLDIRNNFKNESCFIIGSNSTKAGIIDSLYETRPRILLIDEIETMSYDTQESLLNLMETGIISETKKRSTREMQLENTKVFATTNDTRALLGPLISRFIVVNIPPYNDAEFMEIAVKRLTKEEGISVEFATNIIEQVTRKFSRKDLRDCIKVARIAGTTKEIASVVDMMK
jgi:Holliday junction DNA helicase RuvB